VTPDNRDLVWKDGGTTEVRVVAFMTTMAADQYYRSPDGTGRNGTTPPGSPVLWVTMAPELQRFCQRLGVADPGPRIKAWLGLNPATAYDEIVEMWAPVENIFRPCRDSETSDSICDLPSKADPRAPSKVPNYDTFLRKLYESSYQPPSRGGAPWTGLGYTYDYANGEPGIGASEFMLSPDTPYEVTSVQKPSQYCATN